VNIAGGRVRGLQLGLVNVAETADASVGLAAVQTRGETELRAGVDTNGYVGATVSHGAGLTRWLVRAAANPFLVERPGALVSVGFGVALLEPSPELHLDLEAMYGVMLDRTLSQRAPDTLTDVRLVLGAHLFGAVGIYGAIGWRLHHATNRSDPVELGAPFLESELASSTTSLVRAWPTVEVGVELY
jgi:hypothetical protein